MASSIDPKQLDALKPELFALVQKAIEATGMPYASLLVDKSTGIVIAKGYNNSTASFDPSEQGDVYTIRQAQRSLETSDLSHTYLFSFFEPTVLCFDIAMFAHITSFAWCISLNDAPEHYFITEYSLRHYDHDHPGKIGIVPDYARQEALALLSNPKIRIPRGYRLGG